MFPLIQVTEVIIIFYQLHRLRAKVGLVTRVFFNEKNACSMKKFKITFFIITNDKIHMHSTSAKSGLHLIISYKISYLGIPPPRRIRQVEKISLWGITDLIFRFNSLLNLWSDSLVQFECIVEDI